MNIGQPALAASFARNRTRAAMAERHLAVLDEFVGGTRSRPLWRRALSALFTCAIVACAVFLWPARLGGGTNMVVVRGTSMEPVFHLNDVVISRQADNYEVGDVVLFSIPDGAGEGMLVIHRLVDQRDDGSWITQGDNRDVPDAFELRDDDLRGKPVFVVPKAGRLIVWANNLYVLSSAIGLLVILLLWPKKPQPAEETASLAAAVSAPDLQLAEAEPETRRRLSTAAGNLVVLDRVAIEPLVAEQAALDVAAEAEAWLAGELARLGVSV